MKNLLQKSLMGLLIILLSAGTLVFAVEREGQLTGSWYNRLSLHPQEDPNNLIGFESILNLEYSVGTIVFSSTSEFDQRGYTHQLFGADTRIGIMDLGSSMSFDPREPALDYWKSDLSLSLSGVQIQSLFLLQRLPEASSELYGAGMNLGFAGETPGGVSIEVENYFGMEPLDQDRGLITDRDLANTTAARSGYAIVTEHEDFAWDYGASSLQYVGSKLNLESLSLGTHKFNNETLISEARGFEYSQFDFKILSATLPLTLDGRLRFEPFSKSAFLSPSLDLEWTCFQVWTSMPKIDMVDPRLRLSVDGFAFRDVSVGPVSFSSYTALGGNTVADLDDRFRAEGPFGEKLDGLMRLQTPRPSRFFLTSDTYFDMTGTGSLFDLALFEWEAGYEISPAFKLGSGLLISPNQIGGLQELFVSLTYSF